MELELAEQKKSVQQLIDFKSAFDIGKVLLYQRKNHENYKYRRVCGWQECGHHVYVIKSLERSA